ncbi:MAG: hypothetical protein EBS05_14095 [Proteobacteria bacterium]|nr:hypothetical protein [Pseudomonadota bacterium]
MLDAKTRVEASGIGDGSGEWGIGNGKWGIGNRERGMRARRRPPHFLSPIPYFLISIPLPPHPTGSSSGIGSPKGRMGIGRPV